MYLFILPACPFSWTKKGGKRQNHLKKESKERQQDGGMTDGVVDIVIPLRSLWQRSEHPNPGPQSHPNAQADIETLHKRSFKLSFFFFKDSNADA